jgi:hypothetical protein
MQREGRILITRIVRIVGMISASWLCGHSDPLMEAAVTRSTRLHSRRQKRPCVYLP